MPIELWEVAKDWRWLLDLNEYIFIEESPFGDLLLQDKTGAIGLLDINMGEFLYAGVPGIKPEELFPIAFDFRIAHGYIKSGILPAEGQCFGYKTQLVAGGSMELSNVYVATAKQYISFMGDFHHQIQDVPDGVTVTLKVINRKVIQ